MTDTDWITEGAKVVLLTTHTAAESVAVSTIERLTATQVVCANGKRFNRERLSKSTSTYGPLTELLAYDSPEGVRAVSRMRRRNALAKVQKTAVAVTKVRLDGAADDVLLAALDELASAVDHAKAIVAGH